MESREKEKSIIWYMLCDCMAQGRGRSRAISKSNRRNVMATRKNFIDRGNRAEPMGSKPHS